MAGRLLIQRLALQDFRNLSSVVLSPAPRLNVLFGQNGEGKTSLVESLYALCTTRSFRTTRLADAIREGQPWARLGAQVEAFGLVRQHEAFIAARSKSFSIDGKKARRHLDYAIRTPVVAFHPGDLSLVSGAAASRRTLLARVTLYLDPTGADARLDFQNALKERQVLLERFGCRARELEAFEAVAAAHGVKLARAQELAATRLCAVATEVFGQMAAAELAVDLSYRPGGSTSEGDFCQELRERRVRDAARGSASFGPHRDELALNVAGRPARTHASQGQQRLLTLALKLAELEIIRSATELEPILLLDDVSSELDSERTAAVFDLLQHRESQIFVTTTRPELFAQVELPLGTRADFQVARGQLRQV